MALLAACGGGGAPEGAPSPADKYNGGVVDGDGGDGDTAGDSENGVIKIGSGTGDNFTQGVLATSQSEIQAGASSTIVANLVDGNNQAISAPFTVSFTSDCYANGLATFDPEAAETAAGRATTAYTAGGCSGSDTIKATATVGESTLTASVVLDIAADDVLAVRHVSSEPGQLALKGMGGTETSRVTFRLEGAQGAPIIDERVDFKLSTTAGGIKFAEDTQQAISDSEGRVSTVVQSGTVATNVRVFAEHANTGIGGTSGDLVISTGVPVSSKFLISMSDYAPAGAINTDGVEVKINIIASDQFGNDAFDGTRISFWSPESGNIDSSCVLESGRCEVTWISSSPRPADGRSSVIAYTSGAEDF